MENKQKYDRRLRRHCLTRWARLKTVMFPLIVTWRAATRDVGARARGFRAFRGDWSPPAAPSPREILGNRRAIDPLNAEMRVAHAGGRRYDRGGDRKSARDVPDKTQLAEEPDTRKKW